MADLREQLNAIADRLDHLDGHDVDESEELEWAVKQLRALAAQPTPAGEVALPDRFPMNTAPRDGTVIVLHWGEDGSSPGWWSAQVRPIQNADGTWPSMPEGFPWSFVDTDNGSHFVNTAVDTEYGPTSWSPYSDARAAAAASRPATAVPEGWVSVQVVEDVRAVVDGAMTGHCPYHTSARSSMRRLAAMFSAAPQPAAVKQDLTTAHGESSGLIMTAKKLYAAYTDNHPTMHCNRFATWDELGAEQQNEWLHRARMRGLAAIEQASYVGAGGHGIPDEPQPEAKAGAEVTDAMIDAGYAAMLRISFAASPRERLSAMWAAMHAAQPKPAEGGAVEMSPEFTDTARGAIAWVLYHHQGGSSAIGGPLRYALGLGAHDDMPTHLIQQAKHYAAVMGRSTADFHAPDAATRAEEVEENRLISLPNNDAVPAATRIEPGNLFLWNWTAMQDYGRACVEADRIARRLAGKEE